MVSYMARRRMSAILNWTSLALCLLSFTGLVSSLLIRVTMYRSGWAAAMGYGCISVQSTSPQMGTPQRDWTLNNRRAGEPWVRAWWVEAPHPRPGVWAVVIPLWIPCLVFGVVTCLTWRRRPRFRLGHCQGCGYNLAGDVSGVCPECGRALDPDA